MLWAAEKQKKPLMRKLFIFSIALLAFFAVITQFILMFQNRAEGAGETILRFFSYFTILTNSLVALYFIYKTCWPETVSGFIFGHRSFLTALTVYITVVGAVYQLALRHIWNPAGMQKWVDELLHTVIPLLVIFYWLSVLKKSSLQWKDTPLFLVYPLVYLVFVLVRGAFSGFYPYYFINVTDLGLTRVLLNSLVLTLVFVVLSVIFTALGRWYSKNNSPVKS